MRKLSTTFKEGRADTTTGLRLPGMMRESTVRQLKTNLGQVTGAEKRPIGKPKALGQHTAPQKHQMSLIDPSKIKFGFGGPGSTDPI